MISINKKNSQAINSESCILPFFLLYQKCVQIKKNRSNIFLARISFTLFTGSIQLIRQIEYQKEKTEWKCPSSYQTSWHWQCTVHSLILLSTSGKIERQRINVWAFMACSNIVEFDILVFYALVMCKLLMWLCILVYSPDSMSNVKRKAKYN